MCDVVKAISTFDPCALVNYLEEARCYAKCNIEMRQKFIQTEMKHLWNDERVCISGSKKYIKQMKREIKMFEERENTISIILDKIKMGEFSKVKP
jgi:hypothetical protein